MTSSSTVILRYRLRNDSIGGRPGARPLPVYLVYRNLAQEPEIAEHAAGSEDDGGERVVGDGDGEPGLFADALVEIFEQGAAAGEDDAAVADIGAQLGRRALEGDADGVDDGGDALGEGLADFGVVDRDGARDAF